MSIENRYCAVGTFGFMALAGIGTAIMAWFGSAFERETVVPLIAIVTVGLLVVTICAGLKIKDGNSRWWRK